MKRTIAAAGLAAAALFIAPVAIANADEQSFINDLTSAGFSGGEAGTNEALYWGHAACNDSAAGIPLETQIENIYLQTNSTISISDAQYLVESAHIYLC